MSSAASFLPSDKNTISALSEEFRVKVHHYIDYVNLPLNPLTRFLNNLFSMWISGLMKNQTKLSERNFLTADQLRKKDAHWQRFYPSDGPLTDQQIESLHSITLSALIWMICKINTLPFDRDLHLQKVHAEFSQITITDQKELESLAVARYYIFILSELCGGKLTQKTALSVLEMLEGTWSGKTGTGERKEITQRKKLLEPYTNKKPNKETKLFASPLPCNDERRVMTTQDTQVMVFEATEQNKQQSSSRKRRLTVEPYSPSCSSYSCNTDSDCSSSVSSIPSPQKKNKTVDCEVIIKLFQDWSQGGGEESSEILNAVRDAKLTENLDDLAVLESIFR